MLIAKRISRTPPKGELWVRFPLGTYLVFINILGGCIFVCAKYSVGTNVVHAVHGPGTIIDIEEKNFLGKSEAYYVLKIINSELVVNTPVNKENNGIHAVDISRIRELLLSFKPGADKNNHNDYNAVNTMVDSEANYKKFEVSIASTEKNRNRDAMVKRNQIKKRNSEKLKSGNIEEVADVYYYLLKKESTRILAIDEKKMLSQAQKFLSRSFALAFNIESDEAEDMLRNWMNDLIKKNQSE